MSNSDRDLVVAYLHYSGHHHDALSDAEHEHAFTLGDGYGSCTADELGEINGGWDWSHVRDSSPAAIAAIAAYLRGLGCTPEGRRAPVAA